MLVLIEMFLIVTVILGLIELAISFYQFITFSKLTSELGSGISLQNSLGAVVPPFLTILLMSLSIYFERKSKLQAGYKFGIIIMLLALIVFSLLPFLLSYSIESIPFNG